MNRDEEVERGRTVRTVLIIALACAVPVAGMAQTSEAFDSNNKLRFHAETIYGPWSLMSAAAYAGVLQGTDSPREWGQGGAGYGKRVASTVGCTAIYGVLAFGLDSTLHQDPRYFRSGGTGFWHRTGHALRGTMLTRTDRGRETLSTWRLGAAYGSAFLSNQWYPDRLNTMRWGFLSGTFQLGMDFGGNLGSEFWPDIKRKILHRQP